MLKNHPLHEKAKALVKNYLNVENQLIECIQAIDKDKIFQLLGYSSLFQYTISLGLSEAQAYTLIGVARKCVEVPKLQAAIQSGSLSVSKARKIVSVITSENSASWIQKAIDLPQHRLEREVASLSPEVAITERLRAVCSNRIEMRTGISVELEVKLKRVQEIIASQQQQACTLEGALEAMADSYLQRHDPIEKAKRSALNTPKTNGQFSRTVKLNPTIRRQVILRDQGQCRDLDPQGKRCGNRLWIDVHHIISRSEGGRDGLDNLITLCGFHHRLKHHNEGQSWPRRMQNK